MKTPKISLCKLCDDCGFLNDSKPGVLREDLGLIPILEAQVLFPCHKELLGYNGTENTGTHEMVEEKGEIKVCSGLIQSLVLSEVEPKNIHVLELMMDVKEIDPRIMTVEQTIDYHKGQ